MNVHFISEDIHLESHDGHASVHKGHAGHAVVDGRLTSRCEYQLMVPENFFNSCGIRCSLLTKVDFGPQGAPPSPHLTRHL